MARPYAKDTTVETSQSEGEIRKLLRDHGATEIVVRQGVAENSVMAHLNGRWLRFDVRVPHMSEFAHDPAGRKRDQLATARAWEKEERRRWRVLLLMLKAKLEAVKDELADFDREFLGYLLLPDNSTVGDRVGGAEINRIYEEGGEPRFLEALKRPALPGPNR